MTNMGIMCYVDEPLIAVDIIACRRGSHVFEWFLRTISVLGRQPCPRCTTSTFDFAKSVEEMDIVHRGIVGMCMKVHQVIPRRDSGWI